MYERGESPRVLRYNATHVVPTLHLYRYVQRRFVEGNMRIPQWFVLVWVVFFMAVAAAGSVFAYTFVRDRAGELDSVLDLPDPPQIRLSSREPTAASLPPTPSPDAADSMTVSPAADEPPGGAADSTPDSAGASSEAADASAENVAQDVPPVWNDPRQVNVLLLGVDQREGEEGPFPTDTMIFLSLNPADQTAALLTIPRDLWVDFPGIGQPGRINSANIIGDQINYPGGGGPALASRAVGSLLGEEIDHYVLINFEVFTTLIDAIGPVEVCPPEPIDDDQYPDGSYGTISIHFDAGCQALGSERLLQYARTRHGDSDISRSERQQEVILGVRDKVLSAGGVLDLLPRAPALWESVQDNIRTSLSFEEIVSLARAAEKVPEENIRQSQISYSEVNTGVGPNGEEILIPIGSDIELLMRDLLRPAGAPSSRAEAGT